MKRGWDETTLLFSKKTWNSVHRKGGGDRLLVYLEFIRTWYISYLGYHINIGAFPRTSNKPLYSKGIKRIQRKMGTIEEMNV